MTETLRQTQFADVDLGDPFFDSLKAQYKEFPTWFEKKASAKEPVYVLQKGKAAKLQGFVYLKVEDGAVTDVSPALPAARRLKVGTLKIVAHGTKLGERVIKKIFDHAVSEEVEEIYVTVFDTHASLIKLFKRYGFVGKATKTTPNGTEMVLVRSMTILAGDIVGDYPFIHVKDRKFWLLAIYPDYHTSLLPDSILKTETHDILKDVSHTNTIHKVYIAKLALTRLKRGDIVVIYRTTDIQGKARFRSVATSLCVVEEVRPKKAFADADALVTFAEPHSVFTEDELRDMYASDDRLYALKMTYNVALPKRPNRAALLDDVGITEQPKWDLRPLSRTQFERILELGEVNEGLVVD